LLHEPISAEDDHPSYRQLTAAFGIRAATLPHRWQPIFLVYRVSNSLIQPLPQRAWPETGNAMHWEFGEISLLTVESIQEIHGDPREIGF